MRDFCCDKARYGVVHHKVRTPIPSCPSPQRLGLRNCPKTNKFKMVQPLMVTGTPFPKTSRLSAKLSRVAIGAGCQGRRPMSLVPVINRTRSILGDAPCQTRVKHGLLRDFSTSRTWVALDFVFGGQLRQLRATAGLEPSRQGH